MEQKRIKIILNKKAKPKRTLKTPPKKNKEHF